MNLLRRNFINFPILLFCGAGCGLFPGCLFAAVPDKLVVLTFDDSVASHYSVVRPLLKRYGFSATFFITEGISFLTNKQDYMDYLHRNGYRVVALRDLAEFIDPKTVSADPIAIIEKRKTAATATATLVRGRILDAKSHKPLPSRLYIRGENGAWYFPDSASTNGTARPYQRRNWINTNAVEMHTTLSAHPFEIELAPGRYTFIAERGKEYFAETNEVTVGDQPVEVTISLRRWIDMAARGWFSGDTHVHRDPVDLPNVMAAEDVNIAFPMVYWTTDADIPPSRGNKNVKGKFSGQPVAIDATHVYYPLNTEYEIFTTAKRPHTLGALLAVNHRTVFDLPALPVSRVAERAHAEGALLDLEKHNWPWSMALVPLVRPDLFELANNHHWETDFSITNWAGPAPAWMNIGRGSDDEHGWTLYGFLTYYALLDCGFRLSPAAGTANGVHPVPLGFSRVYVHLPRGFSYESWITGLKAGRSFVTTGPMLLVTVNGADAGYVFKSSAGAGPGNRLRVKGEIISAAPVNRIEIIVNGKIDRTIRPVARRSPSGAHEAHFEENVDLQGSGWICVRCWEQRENGRFRFAHTAPWFVEIARRPLRPRREEAEFLVKQVEEEMTRSSAVLSSEALDEYRRALDIYRSIAQTAR